MFQLSNPIQISTLIVLGNRKLIFILLKLICRGTFQIRKGMSQKSKRRLYVQCTVLRATVRCYVSKLSKFDMTGIPHSHQTSVLKSNYANSSNVSTFWYRLQLWIVTVFVQKTRDLLLKFQNLSFMNHSIHNYNIQSREHQPWYIILVMFPVLNIISRVYSCTCIVPVFCCW